MSMQNIYFEYLKDHNDVFQKLDKIFYDIEAVINNICDSFNNGGKLMLCGNGGSAADSQHIAAEFTGRFIKDRKPLPALALTTDTSAITCIGNDYLFDDIFYRQILALGGSNDALIAISTSGNSKNIIRAVEAAKSIGMYTIGLLGGNGGKIKKMCDKNILVPSYITARTQEAHIFIGHVICGCVEHRICNI